MDRALTVKKDAERLHQYREQQRKRGRSNSGHGSHVQKELASSRNHSRGKATHNSYIVCPTYGKRHGNMPCYREIGACFGYGKLWHIIRDYPKNKRLMLKKHKEDRQKPRAQGRAFAMTHRDAQTTSDMVTSTLRIHTLFSRAC